MDAIVIGFNTEALDIFTAKTVIMQCGKLART